MQCLKCGKKESFFCVSVLSHLVNGYYSLRSMSCVSCIFTNMFNYCGTLLKCSIFSYCETVHMSTLFFSFLFQKMTKLSFSSTVLTFWCSGSFNYNTFSNQLKIICPVNTEILSHIFCWMPPHTLRLLSVVFDWQTVVKWCTMWTVAICGWGISSAACSYQVTVPTVVTMLCRSAS